MPGKTQSDSRLEFRLSGNDRSLIEQAASATGQTLTEYAVSRLVRASREVLEQHQFTQMSNRDRDLFLRLIEDEAKPNAALRAAATRYKNQRAAQRK